MFATLGAALTGCTYANSPPGARSAPAQPSAHSAPAPTSTAFALEGKFESQAALTSGSATLSVTDKGAVLQLEDFSTEPGENLRLMLSPGTLGPDAMGDGG